MNMPSLFRRISVGWLWCSGLLGGLLLGGLTFQTWGPPAQAWVQQTIASRRAGNIAAAARASEGAHDHDDHAQDNANSLELSRQALANIGLTAEFLRPVQLETFAREIAIPAIVVERPGRSRIEVSTPMAGVITHVHAVRGEAMPVGTLLFEIRITADELVATQTELLKTLGDLEIEQREITRLEEVTRSGAVPQKTLLERQYAKDKLDVLLAAQKEALRLQGLSERQIQDIIVSRRLLRDLQIFVPAPDRHSDDELQLVSDSQREGSETRPELLDAEPSDAVKDEEATPPLILREVLVHKGERVPAGATLAIVADLSELYVEGRAFEQDAHLLAAAVAQGWKVAAVFELAGREREVVPGLDLLYSASEVDVQSRSLRFYVRLPNTLTRDVPSPNGLRFVEWKYRPGQRLQLRVPVEEWQQQIVLPVEAVVQEGVEAFVFRQNGDHFERIPVHVVFRNQTSVVIRNDGSIFPGDVVARRGAHQMQMALQNRSGGGVDPHAGHNH